jgi:hypothetical protein
MPRASTVRFDRKVALAFRAKRHIIRKRGFPSHYLRAGGGRNDRPAVVRFIIQSNNCASFMLHLVAF